MTAAGKFADFPFPTENESFKQQPFMAAVFYFIYFIPIIVLSDYFMIKKE